MLPTRPGPSASDGGDRTFTIGDRAVELMRAYSETASPQSYELWFTYVTAVRPELNEAVRARLQVGQKISEEETGTLHRAHLSDERLVRQVEQTGDGLLVQLDQIATVIDAAAGSTARYDASLREIASGLGDAPGGSATVRTMIDALVLATREVAEANRLLETSLTDSRSEVASLRETLDHVRSETLIDALTGIANRKHFEETLVSATTAAAEAGAPLALIVVDIDHFKRFNDLYGHLTGDQVLKLVASSMQEALGGRAMLARFGGEEFAMVLPGIGLREAAACAEDVRRSVEARELLKRSTSESLGRITVSLGVASLRRDETATALLERADACMYAAKRAGRNRIVTEAEDIAFLIADAVA